MPQHLLTTEEHSDLDSSMEEAAKLADVLGSPSRSVACGKHEERPPGQAERWGGGSLRKARQFLRKCEVGSEE